MRTQSRQSCQLIPPCRHGNHLRIPHPSAASIAESGGEIDAAGVTGHFVNPISSYYEDEASLIHDLHALKRGEFYERQDFYTRLQAWYKAEVSRLGHWLHAKRTWMWPLERKPSCLHMWESRWRQEAAEGEVVVQGLRKRPTRLQPTRTAKMRASLATRQTPRPVRPGRAKGETKGVYQLADEDWFQHLYAISDAGQYPVTERSGTAIDLALFEERVKSAVAQKVRDLMAARTLYVCALKTAYEAPPFTSRAIAPKPVITSCPSLKSSETGGRIGTTCSVETAPMEISPTLGKWPETRPKHLLQEDYKQNILRIGGLKFAVDICTVFTTNFDGDSDGIRFVML